MGAMQCSGPVGSGITCKWGLELGGPVPLQMGGVSLMSGFWNTGHFPSTAVRRTPAPGKQGCEKMPPLSFAAAG